MPKNRTDSAKAAGELIKEIDRERMEQVELRLQVLRYCGSSCPKIITQRTASSRNNVRPDALIGDVLVKHG